MLTYLNILRESVQNGKRMFTYPCPRSFCSAFRKRRCEVEKAREWAGKNEGGIHQRSQAAASGNIRRRKCDIIFIPKLLETHLYQTGTQLFDDPDHELKQLQRD